MPPPVIDDFNPQAGTTLGGTEVVIAGSEFTGTTDVDFDGTPAASYVVDSDSQITAITPAHADGFAPLTVTTPDGDVTADDFFRFHTPPVVDSLTPSTGPSTGGTEVVIAGLHLNATTDVTFGGTAATFVIDSDEQVTATSPAHAAGTVQVVVYLDGVGSG